MQIRKINVYLLLAQTVERDVHYVWQLILYIDIIGQYLELYNM